jgi:hypothetical protein
VPQTGEGNLSQPLKPFEPNQGEISDALETVFEDTKHKLTF